MQNLLDLEYRKAIIKEILGEENQKRKNESFKRSEIINKRQAPYIEQKLIQEFSKESVKNMRKVTSVNIAGRMVDDMATVYTEAPKREFKTADGKEFNEVQNKQAEALYKHAQVNKKLKRANRILKYEDQGVAQVVPNLYKGVIDLRIYQPHQIDCVPMEDDPQQPFAYIITAFDRAKALATGDGKDQKISDANDGDNTELARMRLVWWSAEHNFITDGHGDIVSEQGKVDNPIRELPFVDIAVEKENEYWVRKGSPITDFAIDFAVILSDTANTSRLQSYAQGYIKSAEKPADFLVGPQQMIWLQIDPNNPQATPEIGFANPNPDMASAIEFLHVLIGFFAWAEGMEDAANQIKNGGQKYSSALERLIALLEKYDEARDDLELFADVEHRIFKLLVKWSNAYQGVKNNPLLPDLQHSVLPEDAEVCVNFHKPEMIQTKSEQEQSEIALYKEGFRSKVMVLMKLDGLTEEQAIEKVKLIEQHNKLAAPEEPEAEELEEQEEGKEQEPKDDEKEDEAA